jgi:WD40 repeat protein
MLYNAFISYSHAADGKMAPALQAGLEKFAKPWYKIRNLNIFRDEASLTATPHLWPNIQKALDQSEYLVYMASPVSASSHWVSKEIEYWVANKSIDKLLIVLTEGEIRWDNTSNVFLNAEINALPGILDKKFTVEPFYIDLRTAKTQKDLSLNNPIFKKEVLKLAAQLHNKEPKDLASEEVAAHQKMIRVRNAAIGILIFLFMAACFAAWLAVRNANEAVREKNKAQANYLVSEAQRESEKDPTLALRLAEAAMKQNKDSFVANIAHSIYRKNSFYRIITTLQKTKTSSNAFTAVVFSAEGKSILTGSGDGIPRLWQSNGQLIREFKAHAGTVWSVGFSKDGQSILTQADSTIRILDIDGNLQHEIIDHSGLVSQTVVGPGIKDFASYISPAVRFFKVYSTLSQQFSGNIFSHNRIAFSPDGKFIVTDDFNDEINISDSAGKIMLQFKPHKKQLTSISVSPDGKNILTSSFDSTARLWDLKGNLVAEMKGHSDIVNDAVFSPDGKLILSGGQDGTFKLWSRGGILIEEFKGNYYGGNCMDFSPDGKSIVTGCDQTLRLWSIRNLPVQEFIHPERILSVAYSPDGNKILTGCFDRIARLWDTTGNLIREFKGHYSIIPAVAFSPDGKSVLTGSWDNTMRLYNFDGTLIREFELANGTISSVAFSPDGQYILSGSDDSTARLWDMKGNILQEFRHRVAEVSSVTFSPDGKFILSSCRGNDAPKLFDRQGKLIREFKGATNYVAALAISPDGRYVATVGYGNYSLKLWDIEGRTTREFLGHTLDITTVAFSPDGRSIITGARDNTVRWWNLNGDLIREFKGFAGDVNSVAFSPDGKYILAAISDNTAKVWKCPIPLEEFLQSDQVDPLTGEQKKKFGIK